MLRKISYCAFLFALLLHLSPAFPQERTKLRVSSATKTLGYGPLWVASKMGFFDRQGLDVDLVVIRASDVGIQALAGGSLEIAGSAADSPIAAVEKGLDLVMIGGIINCLTQSIEGDFDSSHTTLLHWNNLADLARLNRDGAPNLEAEETEYGMRAISIRQLGVDKSYVRISPFIMPAFSIVPGPATAKFEANDSRAFRFWIPIDDTSTWFYILTMRDMPFSAEERASARSWVDAGYRRIRNAGNNYLQNREHQKTRSYSGVKAVLPAEQDGCATANMGPIYDRTQEHLGYSDKTIIALRKVLLQAARNVQEGGEPPHIVTDPKLNDFSRLRAVKGVLPANGSWRELPELEQGVV